jgi:hypothetical protein
MSDCVILDSIMIDRQRKTSAEGAKRPWLTTAVVLLVCVSWSGPQLRRCEAGEWVQGENGDEKRVKKKKEKKTKTRSKYVSNKERKRLLAMATVTLDEVWGMERNVMGGPVGAPAPVDPASGAISRLRLTYSAEKGVAGRTHKFWGRDSEGKKWKIKYDSEEVFTEMAATRLMWKMGYAADHAFPVRELICIGCKDENPWSSMDHGRAPPVEGRKIIPQKLFIVTWLPGAWFILIYRPESGRIRSQNLID